MDTESGEMYPTLIGNCDFSEIPLRIVSEAVQLRGNLQSQRS